MKIRSIIATAILFCSQAAHADFSGELIRVLDGDTVEVVTQDHPIAVGKTMSVRIRLADIDAPESGQAFGNRSRQHLAGLVFRQKVRVQENAQDQYGRTLGVIYFTHCEPQCVEVSANNQMVLAGMAWAYRFRDKATNPEMLIYEGEAKKEKRGLWSDPNAQEPWKWRRGQKQTR